MPDIHIERAHSFGLAHARALAVRWVEQAEREFGMACESVDGSGGDTVRFSRSGVTGTVRVEADRFVLDATLGFLLGGFRKTIEAEIEKNLDALLAAAGPAPVAAKKRPARPGRAARK